MGIIRLQAVYTVLFAGVFAVCGCSAGEELVRSTDAPDHVIEGLNVNHMFKGRIEWNLRADHARVFDAREMAVAENPDIRFFEDGKLSSTMKSQKARLHTGSSDIDAWGDVVIISAVEETRMETSKVRYDAEKDRIVSDEPVRLYRKDSVTTGVGMESTVDLSTVIIRDQRVEIDIGSSAADDKTDAAAVNSYHELD